MRKLLICPWFGPLPAWYYEWQESVGQSLKPAGYDLLLDTDPKMFSARVATMLRIDPVVPAGGNKVCDFRACLGALYEHELRGYDFWGHTDLDCVYGRVSEFWPDELLVEHDVLTDNRLSYISGPWTLYRNTPEVNQAFASLGGWQEILQDPETTGWVEQSFTEMVREQFSFLVEEHHAWAHPELLHRDGDRLMMKDREVSFFHFRYTKRWPL